MSTSAYIQVFGSDVIIYKHWGGYPSSTLPFLRAFHAKFLAARGCGDDAYETAQLLRATIDMEAEFKLDESRDTGWGLFAGKAEVGDEEYVYILNHNGSITVNGKEYLADVEPIFSEDE